MAGSYEAKHLKTERDQTHCSRDRDLAIVDGTFTLGGLGDFV